MKKAAAGRALALAVCILLCLLAFAGEHGFGRGADVENGPELQEIAISSLTDSDLEGNETLADFVDKLDFGVPPTPRGEGPHYTQSFDKLYHTQVVEPSGDVYDYYISPAILAFCNDLRDSETWYTVLSVTMAAYLNGIEIGVGPSGLSLRNIRAEMSVGSDDVYFTGAVDFALCNGSFYTPESGTADGGVTNTIALGFEGRQLSADNAWAELAARVSLYNDARQQEAAVSFKWSYDIYLDDKYVSSRVLGTSEKFEIFPLAQV